MGLTKVQARVVDAVKRGLVVIAHPGWFTGLYTRDADNHRFVQTVQAVTITALVQKGVIVAYPMDRGTIWIHHTYCGLHHPDKSVLRKKGRTRKHPRVKCYVCGDPATWMSGKLHGQRKGVLTGKQCPPTCSELCRKRVLAVRTRRRQEFPCVVCGDQMNIDKLVCSRGCGQTLARKFIQSNLTLELE